MAEVERGNRPKEYIQDPVDLKKESNLVSLWRQRIAREVGNLQLVERLEAAANGDEYLDGAKKSIPNKAVYFNYLRPLISDTFRAALPSLPIPQVEGMTAAGEAFEEKARSLISMQMHKRGSQVENVARQVLWDDARSGAGFARTVWKTEYQVSKPDMTADPDAIASQIDRIDSENASPLNAMIADGDIHHVHYQEHMNALSGMAPGGDEYWALSDHANEHKGAMTVIRMEWPTLERVPWNLFVYDTDVPWEERAWEAQQRSERIQELIGKGYRNVNPENLKAELKLGETSANTSYEEMTARIWEIHDRISDKFFVISVEGPEDGLFLHKGKWIYSGPDKIDIYLPIMTLKHKAEAGFGASLIQACIEILERLAIVDAAIDKHVRTHADYKTLLPRGSMDKSDKAAMNDPNRRFIELAPEAMAGMKEHEPPPIPQTLLDDREILLSELRRQLEADAQDTGTPNPHQISATESAHRANVREDRKAERQRIMSEFLSDVCRNFLMLFKKFATKAAVVPVVDEMGKSFATISPDDIPDALDVMLDVTTLSDSARAQDAAIATEYVTFMMSSQLPIDYQKLSEWYGRKLGVERPEQFRAAAPVGPENIQPGMGGQPGIPNQQPQMPQGMSQQMSQQPQQTPMQPQAAAQ